LKTKANDGKGRSEAAPNAGNFCSTGLDFQQTPEDLEGLETQAEKDK